MLAIQGFFILTLIFEATAGNQPIQMIAAQASPPNMWERMRVPIIIILVIVALNILLIRFIFWLRRRMEASAEHPPQQDKTTEASRQNNH